MYSTVGVFSNRRSRARKPIPKSKSKNVDLDVDVKLGAVAGYFGEALRSVDAKLSRRNGTIRSFAFSSKLGRDTPLTADLRGRAQGHEVIYLETNDAGAFLRFTDTYSKVVGGQLQLAMDPPTVEPSAREGLLNVKDFPSRARVLLIVWRRAARPELKAVSAFRGCARSLPGRMDSSRSGKAF